MVAITGETNFQAEQAELVDKSGKCLVDIVVATPGRLVDHLASTQGFSLEHLEFLVIDEADRLMDQAYHDWIGKVIAAVHQQKTRALAMENGYVSFHACLCADSTSLLCSSIDIRALSLCVSATQKCVTRPNLL